MIRPVAITPGAIQFAVIPNSPRSWAGATIGGRCGPGDQASRDDLPETLLLYHRGCTNRRSRTSSSPRQAAKARIKCAGLGVHGPTTTAIGIRDQHINFQGPPPSAHSRAPPRGPMPISTTGIEHPTSSSLISATSMPARPSAPSRREPRRFAAVSLSIRGGPMRACHGQCGRLRHSREPR